MRSRSRDEHLFSPGPKRILALDGGGIRGIVSLQFLKLLEERLRRRHRAPDSFRLCDYFDLVGGTSTGAIIAAGIAVGFSARELEEMYLGLGRQVFDQPRSRLVAQWAVPKFPAAPLRELLEEKFGDVRLGDAEIRTGLAIVTKRLDTGSPWVLHNNPRGRYFDRRPGSAGEPNRSYLVSALVRASTAAPTYFAPERIAVADGVEGVFVDGGVSPHNNPALQLLMLATLAGHGLRWPLGADRLLLVSVGTGSWPTRLSRREAAGGPAALSVVRSLHSLMDDAGALNEQLLQWLSHSPTARVIDREVGDLADDILGGGEPWLTYLRYDVRLEADWLAEHAGAELSGEEIHGLREMDRPENLERLAAIGAAAAPRLMAEAHLPPAFDLPTDPETPPGSPPESPPGSPPESSPGFPPEATP